MDRFIPSIYFWSCSESFNIEWLPLRLIFYLFFSPLELQLCNAYLTASISANYGKPGSGVSELIWKHCKSMIWRLKNTESPFSGRSLNACGVNESAHELILYLHFHQLIEPSGTNVLWHFTVYHIYERNDHCRSALANAMYGSSSCQWNTMTPTLWRIYCGKLWRAQLKRRWMFIFFLNGQVFFVSHSVTFHTS